MLWFVEAIENMDSNFIFLNCKNKSKLNKRMTRNYGLKFAYINI